MKRGRTSTDLTVRAGLIIRVLVDALHNRTAKRTAARLDPQLRLDEQDIDGIRLAHGFPSTRSMATYVRQLWPMRHQPVCFDLPAPPPPNLADRVPCRWDGCTRTFEPHTNGRAIHEAAHRRADQRAHQAGAVA